MIIRYFLTVLLLFSLSISSNAQEKPILYIYTYDSFSSEWGAGPKLKKRFEKKCNCTLKWVSTASSISALRKIQLEGDKSKADILLGLDSSIISKGELSGLFENHEIDTKSLKVPNDWRSDIFLPFDFGYFAFVYNKEKLKNPPSSFLELAQMDKDFKIIIQDPRSSTVGFGLMLWLKAAYDEDSNQVWADISPHILTITRSWGEAYNLFLKDEADMVLSYSTSPAYHLIAEDDDKFQAANFNEGHYLQVEVAGILKNSVNKKLARKFLDFLISDEAQAIITTSNWMYPVKNIDLPKGFENLISPKNTLLINANLIENNSQKWIDEMFEAIK